MKFLVVCKMNGSIIRNVLALCILALCSVFITNTFMPYECWSDEVGVDNKSESISTDEIALLSNSLQPEVTWTSRNNPNSTILESGYNLEGDHIIIKAELIPENSSMTKAKMEFFGKSQLNVTHPLMLITRNNPIYQIDLDWVIVENITKGLMVNIEVNFSNSNCDIYAWWNDELNDDERLELATGYRWLTHWRISEIKPFGHGFIVTEFYKGIPHNIILIIIEQVGILGALAWLFVIGYCLIKTKWKYALILQERLS